MSTESFRNALALEYEVSPDDYAEFGDLPEIDQLELGILQNLRGTELKEAMLRWEQLRMLQDLYTDFESFLRDMYQSMFPRFTCTAVQVDIGLYLQFGPKYRMIQAQRGQAKTTITAAYAVWRLIHNPATRVLIFSAGGDMASQIALWVIQIIQGMDVLAPLRPDVNNRTRIQRSSVGAFDVHWMLKGPDKSPSVACLGITANMQGFRADVLIADDIESSKNSLTEITREQLRHRTRDFTSINSTGDIIYLGTPQSVDSIYNDLPARGFDIRIWTGRYPTLKEEENYSTFLAPFIVAAMKLNPELRSGGGLDGSRGQPVDPVILGEQELTAKELDQGAAYFQLQHMLDTRLSDELRFPLKSRDLMVMHIDPLSVPTIIQYLPGKEREVWHTNSQGLNICMYRPIIAAEAQYIPLEGIVMFIDPAGSGADEAGYGVVGQLMGNLFILDIGGISNGITDESFRKLAAIAIQWQVDLVQVERNFGGGMYGQQVRAAIEAAGSAIPVSDDIWASGQKECRIADTMAPVMAAHRVVINEAILRKDVNSTQHYPVELRGTYQFFHQLVKLTRDRDCLIHDDRLDAVSGGIAYWVGQIALSMEKVLAKTRAAAYERLMQNPLGKNQLTSLADLAKKPPKQRGFARNRFKK